MNVIEHLRNFLVLRIDLTDPVNGIALQAGISYCCSTIEPDRSLSEHHLDAEPYCAKATRNDDGYDSLERVTLRLLDALPPTAQMLEIGTQLSSIRVLDSERGKDRRYRPLHDRVDIVALQPLLFGQCLGDDGPDIFLAHRLTA
jgi:hypothetical protein